jgi:hypothetical protein
MPTSSPKFSSKSHNWCAADIWKVHLWNEHHDIYIEGHAWWISDKGLILCLSFLCLSFPAS